MPLSLFFRSAALTVLLPAVIVNFVGAQVPEEPISNGLKLKQTFVNGLLVMPLPSGKEAGQASRMNLTALPGQGGGNINFNQQVGEDMGKALQEVKKFIFVRHSTFHSEHDLEIAFEDKYSGKDGPSAAVACALLLEAAITGHTWDPAFAVTGDMNADGSVQPIGGVGAKVRGATNGSCKIVAVPAKNASAVTDILVADGPAPFVGINVFAIAHFDEAVALASTARPPQLQQAISEFEVIRQVLLRDPPGMSRVLRTPQAAARLQAVVDKAPNCLSARLLHAYAIGRPPATLSLGGSIEATDSRGQALVKAINSDFGVGINSLKPDELGGILNNLRNLRPRTDRRVWPYLDSLVTFGEIIRVELLNPSRSASRAQETMSKARAAGNAIGIAKDALLANPQVIEELGL